MGDEMHNQPLLGALEATAAHLRAACMGDPRWFEIHWYGTGARSRWQRVRPAVAGGGLLIIVITMVIGLIELSNNHVETASSHPDHVAVLSGGPRTVAR